MWIVLVAVHRAPAAAAEQVDVEVQHVKSVSVTLALSPQDAPGLADLTEVGSEPVQVSVPQEWNLREVRGGTLAEVHADPPSLGYRRWHLPPNRTVSFTVPHVPASVRAINNSTAPLLFRLTRVDTTNTQKRTDVMIVTHDPQVLP